MSSNYPIPAGYVVVPGCGAGERSATQAANARREAKREAARDADAIRAAYIRALDRNEWLDRAVARREAAEAEVARLRTTVESLEQVALLHGRVPKDLVPTRMTLDAALMVLDHAIAGEAAERAKLEPAS